MKRSRPEFESLTGSARRLRVAVPALLSMLAWTAVASAATSASTAVALNARGAGAPAGLPDIHDIRPPLHIDSGWIWFAAAGCCVFVAFSVAGWYWWRRRVLGADSTPAERALRRLEEARALLIPGQARTFSIAVSGIVRTYIEQRFDIGATQRTTTEFLQDCLSLHSGSLADRREQLGAFLQHCDLAKFAKWDPEVAEMEGLLGSAIAFVTGTVAPDPVPPIVADSPVGELKVQRPPAFGVAAREPRPPKLRGSRESQRGSGGSSMGRSINRAEALLP